MPSQEDGKQRVHYSQSPSMIRGRVSCCRHSQAELASMDIDRRWECDGRVPLWSRGMADFSFGRNFLYGGNAVCPTDDEVIRVVDKNLPESQEEVATRQIRFNGQGWIQIP